MSSVITIAFQGHRLKTGARVTSFMQCLYSLTNSMIMFLPQALFETLIQAQMCQLCVSLQGYANTMCTWVQKRYSKEKEQNFEYELPVSCI